MATWPLRNSLAGATDQLRKHLFGGILLGAPAARPLPVNDDLPLGDFANDDERLLVRLARRRLYRVLRQFEAATLQPLLKSRLGIFETCGFRKRPQSLVHEAAHARLGFTKPAIQQDRPNDGLDGIGQNRGTSGTAGAYLSRPDDDMRLDGQLPPDLRQCVALDERSTQPAQIAFGIAVASVVESSSDDKVQKRITQKLQAFVILFGRTTVRERPLQQVSGFETVCEAFVSPFELGCYRLT